MTVLQINVISNIIYAPGHISIEQTLCTKPNLNQQAVIVIRYRTFLFMIKCSFIIECSLFMDIHVLKYFYVNWY